jgi:hypothetical protein
MRDIVDAIPGDADGRISLSEFQAVPARSVTVDEQADFGEEAGCFVKEQGERERVETIDEGVHLLLEGVVFLERDAAEARGAVDGAEFLSTFGKAAAFPAVGEDVGAFFDHDDFSEQEKRPAAASLLS